MLRRHLTPALLLFIVLLGCCLLGPFIASRWWAPLAAAALAAALATALVRGKAHASRPALFLACAAAGLTLGAASLARMSDSARGAYLPVAETDVSRFSGRLTQDSSVSQKGETVLRLALREAASTRRGIGGQARGVVMVLLEGDYRFSMGQCLSVRAPLATFGSFGPEHYVARAGRADVRSEGFAGGLWAARAAARDWLHRAVARAGYPASALLEALLIGSREDVPASLYDGFKRTGSLHILALSGLHVTVIYGIIGGLLGFLRSRGLKFAVATALLLFYQVLAGFMPSLLRATVMILVGGTALLLDRDAEPINLLALSGIAILMTDPFQAFSLSFQLSFLALGGILALGPLIQRPLQARLPKLIVLTLAMSVGAQIATLPLVIGQFGTYYPSGLIAGLLLVPLTTALLWAGLAWLPISLVPWHGLHDLCAAAFSLLYKVIDWCAWVFGRPPGVAVGAGLAPWVIAASALAMLFLALALPARRKAVSAASLES
jgi:competence protein ComEC